MQTLYKLIDINSKRLVIERDKYQRNPSEEKINQIVATWDERIANEPKVSLRDGVYRVFDGQHTILAREALNDHHPVKILCKVYYGLTEQDEADLFAKQTGRSSKPSPGERHRAEMYAGNETAIAFSNATKKAGLSIDDKGTRHKMHISCIGTAQRAYEKMGEALYIEAMSIIATAWKGKADSLRFEIIKAVTEFVQHYNGQYDKNVLIGALKGKKPISIRNKIVTDLEHPQNIKYAYQIMAAYNAKSETPLPEIKVGEKSCKTTQSSKIENFC